MIWACVAPLEQVLAACDGEPNWLGVAERERWAGFATAARRRQFLAGRWLARLTLAHVGGGEPGRWPLTLDGQGRCLAPGPWTLSLSHSGGWVGVAVGEGLPVGFDIQAESRRRDWQALAAFAGLQPCPDAACFYRHWTLAEAWLKAHADIASLTELREMRWQADSAGPAWQGQAADLHWACVGSEPPQWLTDAVPGALVVSPGQGWAPLTPACAPPD